MKAPFRSEPVAVKLGLTLHGFSFEHGSRRFAHDFGPRLQRGLHGPGPPTTAPTSTVVRHGYSLTPALSPPETCECRSISTACWTTAGRGRARPCRHGMRDRTRDDVSVVRRMEPRGGGDTGHGGQSIAAARAGMLAGVSSCAGGGSRIRMLRQESVPRLCSYIGGSARGLRHGFHGGQMFAVKDAQIGDIRWWQSGSSRRYANGWYTRNVPSRWLGCWCSGAAASSGCGCCCC